MLLRVNDIAFGYSAQHQLFAGVTFDLAPGQMIHITGPNGAGKSTLLHVLCGARTLRHGTFRWAEVAQGFSTRYQYLAADDNGHYLEFSAFENLAYWADVYRQPKSVITPALDRWGFGNHYQRSMIPTQKLSTGMRRRLALARMELTGGQVWLLDEPTSGLDQEAIALTKSAISQHLSRGGAAIVIAHDLSLPEARVISLAAMSHTSVRAGGRPI